jgi:hypothetical protein
LKSPTYLIVRDYENLSINPLLLSRGWCGDIDVNKLHRRQTMRVRGVSEVRVIGHILAVADLHFPSTSLGITHDLRNCCIVPFSIKCTTSQSSGKQTVLPIGLKEHDFGLSLGT